MYMETILEVRHLSKQYSRNGNGVEAVADVSLCLKRGEILGIVGESGSGKSTLLRQIGRLENPDQGQIFLYGADITNRKTQDICRKMQMIFQDPLSSFNPRHKTSAAIDEMLRNLAGCGRKEAVVRRNELIRTVGLLPELADRYPFQISGGQCQRLAVARALAAEPEILLCDEITSALDVSAQAQIVSMLAELRKKLGLSMIFVSHDLALVSCLCDRIMVMKNGSCVEEGSREEIVKRPQSEYTRDLLSSVMMIE